MDFSVFKSSLLEELSDFYGKDAKVYIVQHFSNNTGKGDGICIQFTDDDTAPVISLNELYQYYIYGNLDMVDCVGWIIDRREKL